MSTSIHAKVNLISVLSDFILLALFFALLGCGGKQANVEKDKAAGDVSSVAVRPAPVPQPKAPVPAVVSESAIVTVPAPPAPVTYVSAEAAYRAGKYDEALSQFAQYTEEHPVNPWGFYMLGLSAWKSGQLEQAEAAFQQALEIDPGHAKSWINFSRVLIEAGKPEQAADTINEALALEPESGTVFRIKGRVYHELGHRTIAAEAYRQAIMMDASDAWSMNNLALLLIEELRFDEALPMLALAVRLKDNVAVFHNNLGITLENTGRFRASTEAYQSAIALDSTYEKAAVNLARTAGVTVDPDIEPIDLESFAYEFEQKIEHWRNEATVTQGTDVNAESGVSPMEEAEILPDARTESQEDVLSRIETEADLDDYKQQLVTLNTVNPEIPDTTDQSSRH